MPRPVVLRFLGDTSQLTRSFNATAAQSAALSAQIGAMNSRLAAASQTLIAAGATMSRRFTLPISYATGASAYLASTFEASMTKIETLAGESAEQVAAWTENLEVLARTIPKSPQELADALYFIASSGIDAQHAMSVLVASAKASVVGLGETKVVADALTSAINAYGIENLNAAKAADILIGAVREGKGEAEDIAGSIGRVIAPAQLLGVSFDQVAAALSSMTLVGLSADESATALRQIFFTLAKPSAMVKDALADIGLSAEQVRKSIRDKGLLATLTDLREKIGDNDELLAHMFPNIRAFNGLTIMTGENLGNTARIFDILSKESGTLGDAYERTSETSKFKFEAALNRLRLVGMDVGQAVLPRLVDNITRLTSALIEGWKALSPAAQEMVINIALIVAAIGPLLRVLGNVGALLGLIAAHPVIAAIVAIGAAFYIAYQRSEEFRAIVDAVAVVLRDALQTSLEWLRVNGPKIWKAIQDAAGDAWRVLQAVAKVVSESLISAFSAVTRAGRAVGGSIADAFRAVQQAVQPVASWFVEWVAPVIAEAFGLIGDVLTHIVVPAVSEAFGVMSDVLDVFIAAAGPVIDGLISSFLHMMEVVGVVLQFLVEAFKAAWTVVKPIIEAIGSTLITIFSGAFNIMKGIIEGFLQTIQGILQVLRGVVTGDWGKVWEGVQNIFGGIWHAMSNMVETAIRTIVNLMISLPGKILSVLGGLADAGWQLGSAFINGLVDGIKGIANAAIDIAGGIGEAVFDALKTGWNKIVDFLNRTTNGIEIDPPGPGPTFGLPDNMWSFLKLANGGVFTSPTFAMIGEAGAEAVIPLERPQRAAAVMREAGLLPSTSQVAQSTGPSLVVNQEIHALDPYEAARRADADWQWAMKTTIGR